ISCHTVSINDTVAAEVHNPLGLASNHPGYITCRECHEAHSNQGGNIKLVGYLNDGENFFEPVTPPAIRKELPETIDLTYNVVTFTSPTEFNIDGSPIGVCEVCHDPYHNAGNDCTQCHSHSGGFPKPDCTAVGCHDGNGTGALAVGVGSSHSTDTIFASKGVTFTCGDCHTSHGTAGTVLIPNNPTVGINYNSAGHGGISLGSTVATGVTEAEICWNCHDRVDVGVSEWGDNTDTNGAGSNFNFGTVNPGAGIGWYADTTPGSEVGASWTSANFGYKTSAIQSTHSVDGTATKPGLDPVANIRCSYCHDVHDLNTLVTDTSSGKPYLRGSWMGNPYREDGSPQNGTNYGQYEWGNVPRGSVLNNEYGGYQIDQNNGNPTSGWTPTDSAGLCTICHGSDVDVMNKFNVDESGSAETTAQSWVGNNGHSNAVIGGTGSNRVNIFYTSDRAPNGVDTEGAKPDMGYRNHGSSVGYGFRGTDGRSFVHLPGMDGSQASNSSRPYGGNYYEWGATVDEGTTDVQYHKFSCSKCHNPHSSRLPRLLITNCLDTNHNTWDENAGDGGPSIANENNNKVALGASTAPDSWGRTWSNTTSAQNCHRLAGDNRATAVPGFGAGWNNVTPW
ncbi:MAG: hypothetical protein N2C12_10415, partial [Planctomycetales bacterium]